MSQETEFDGLLYLGDNIPPPPPSAARSAEGDWWGTGVLHHFEEARTAETVLYERALLKTKDPTTPPHVRKKCVKKLPLPGGGWTCIGWKIEYQWFYVMATLRVTTKTPVDIKSAVEDCLKQGAIAAAIAAILTGGSGAPAAAAAAIKACLMVKLGENLLHVSVDLSHEWGKWE